MDQSDALVQIKSAGCDVYIGATSNDTWIRLSASAFNALVFQGRPAFHRACGQPGSLFHVNDSLDSATFVRIGDQIHIGTANIVRYVELSQVAILAIFNCGLHARTESATHGDSWVQLHADQARATAA